MLNRKKASENSSDAKYFFVFVKDGYFKSFSMAFGDSAPHTPQLLYVNKSL